MTSDLKSVPPYPFFCLISIYFACCFKINYRVLISKYHSFQKTIMDWDEHYIKQCYVAFEILD